MSRTSHVGSAGATAPEGGPGRGGRARVVAFVAVCALAAAVAVAYALRAAGRVEQARAASSSVPSGAGSTSGVDWAAGPHLAFLGTGQEQAFSRLAVVPLDGPEQAPALSDLRCQVVHAAAGRGLCLAPERELIAYTARVFDERFRTVRKIPLAGLPSRARVAPDGMLGAVTVFVSGHSYAIAGFSTATTFIDMGSGQVVANLEEFAVLRDGKPFTAPDFNYWGVTFGADGRHFYATLGTGGRTHLVEGDVGGRTVRVLRGNVECPSLSPDGTRLVFKKRASGGLGPVQWRLHVLDLATLEETPLAETRSVDDQAEWLDDRRVAYAVPRPGPSGVSDTWVVPVDASAAPRVLVAGGRSPVAVRQWPTGP